MSFNASVGNAPYRVRSSSFLVVVGATAQLEVRDVGVRV